MPHLLKVKTRERESKSPEFSIHKKLQAKKLKSFMLIELLVVVAIIGLLAALGMSSLGHSRLKARDAKRLKDFDALTTALEMYLSTNNSYPVWSTGGCTSDGTSNPLSTALVPTYIGSLPKDPKLNQYCYYYKTDSAGSQYKLVAKLEGDTTKPASDGGTATNYYEKYASAGFLTSSKGLQIGADADDNPDLLTIMNNQAAVGDTTIVVYWKFGNQTSGSIANNTTVGFEDSSAYANNGTTSNANGTGMAWTTGVSGGAVSFDGVDDRVDSSAFDLGAISSLTMGAWVKGTASTPSGGILYKSNTVMDFCLSGGSLQTYIKNDVAWHGAAVSPGYSDWTSWHFVVAVYNGSNVIIYRDGNQVAISGAETGNFTASNAAAWIGMNSGGSYLAGTIDDVRIYNRALSASEVCTLCKSKDPGSICSCTP